MQKVLITGSSGLIGSHVIPMLSETYEIHALSRHASPAINSNITYYTVDLNGNIDYSQLPDKVDAIIYLAQSDHFREFPEKAKEVFQINTMQVIYMLDYARRAGVKTFIYASSGGVYGSSEKGIAEDILIPASGNIGFYLSTKLCSEIIAENFSPYMNIVMLRFFFVYGKGQKRGMLIPRLVDNVCSGNAVTLQGENGIEINPIHVSDAAYAIKASFNLQGCHKINVAGPDILSLRQICNLIGEKVGITPIYQVDNTVKPLNLIGDIENMKKYLHEPSCHFYEGISDLI